MDEVEFGSEAISKMQMNKIYSRYIIITFGYADFMDESKYVKTLNKSIYIYKQIICSKYIALARTMARTGLSFVVTVS